MARRSPTDRAPPSADQPVAQPPSANWSTKNPICLQLEQRLVQETQGSNQARDLLPRIERDMRQAERTYQQASHSSSAPTAMSSSCSPRRCGARRAASSSPARWSRRSGASPTSRRSASRSWARASAPTRTTSSASLPATTAAPATSRKRGAQDAATRSPRLAGRGKRRPAAAAPNQFGNLPFATYRTLCVRLCDGYYFPVSFSTLPNHFQRDADSCQSQCAAPAELYYHQNPGGGRRAVVALHTQQPYTSLKTALRYRKEFVQGCSCKEAEYTPPEGEQTGKRADTDATTGWEARSEPEAKSR